MGRMMMMMMMMMMNGLSLLTHGRTVGTLWGAGGGGGLDPGKASKAPPRFGYIPPNDVLYSSTSKYVAGDTSST